MSPLRCLLQAVCRFCSRVNFAFELWAGYDFAWRDAWNIAGGQS